MTTTSRDGPPIPIHRLILLPVAILGGTFAGPLIGAVFLPYVVVNEVIRKLGQSWSYLDGWVDWAENGAAKAEQKPGWMVVWLLWVFCYFASMVSWAPVAGLLLGPFVAAWIVLVPSGWDRFLAGAQDAIKRVRRIRIRIVETDQDRDAA